QQQSWAQATGQGFDFPLDSFSGNRFENGQANTNGTAGQQGIVGANPGRGGPFDRNLPTGGGAVPLGQGGNHGVGGAKGGVAGGGGATPLGGGGAANGGAGGGGAAAGGGGGAAGSGGAASGGGGSN